MKIKTFSPITSWQIDGETMETVRDFIFLGSKITVDRDCSHEIKRPLFFGRKVMANLDNILKNRDITLPTKICIVIAMVFPVVTYGCESWTIRKAERWRIDGFELWCWRRFLRVPWTARISSWSILKEINPKYSLEKLMLKQKLQYFGHLMQRTDLFEKTLTLGKIEGRRRRGWQRMRWLDWNHCLEGQEFEQALGVVDGLGNLACYSPCVCKELDTTEWLNWTEALSWFSNIQGREMSIFRMCSARKLSSSFEFVLCCIWGMPCKPLECLPTNRLLLWLGQ